MSESRRKQEECSLTLCDSLQVNTGGFGLGGGALTQLLPYNTVQSAPYRTANINTFVWNIWLHHLQQIRAEREREKERGRYALRSSYFTLITRPLALSVFPYSNCNALFRRRTGGKKRACDWRVWCGHWKEFSTFLALPQKNETEYGGRVDKILENIAARQSTGRGLG